MTTRELVKSNPLRAPHAGKPTAVSTSPGSSAVSTIR
jgi:hypothetical protein